MIAARWLVLVALAGSAAGAVEHRLALVTAYSPDVLGGGAGTGLTSTGGRTAADPFGVAACPTMLPPGSLVAIPGYRDTPEKGGPWWTVDDTGGAMRQAARRGVLHLDIRMRSARSARAWGARWMVVRVWVPDRED